MIIEETKTGARRHTMSRAELEHLYKEIERFVADSMPDECRENEQAIKGIETMIHQRMRTADVPGILKVWQMGLEISDPVLLYIRPKSEILTGNPEILRGFPEISFSRRRQNDWPFS